MSNVSKTSISIKVATGAPINHYLMFTNDCLMFCEANRKVAWHVKDILKNYYKVPDQLVNFYKSAVQFSKGTEIRQTTI